MFLSVSTDADGLMQTQTCGQQKRLHTRKHMNKWSD